MPHTTFLSHAHADNELCARYAAALQARGIDVWLDLINAHKGQSLSVDITTQLEVRSAFLLMVTKSSNDSFWVALERDNFIALWAGKATHRVDGVERIILPVLLELCPIPAAVRGFNWIDATNRPFDDVVEEITRALEEPSGPPPFTIRKAVERAASVFSGRVGGPAHVPTSQLAEPSPADVLEPTTPGHVPPRLAQLGFASRNLGNIQVIVPPVCDIPAGEFLMGSDPVRDTQARDIEKPQHRVSLAAYQIGRYPITVAEYACFVRAGQNEPQNWQQHLGKLDHPVVNISWHDAVAYAAWLAKLTGQPWRLPTEAEWEKAARGADGRNFPWGDAFDCNRCNTYGGEPHATTPVGAFADRGDASPCGAHDLAGNVWEWTNSLVRHYRYRADDGRERADSTESRVRRGGSWHLLPKFARPAYRGRKRPGDLDDDVGFRLAVAVVAGS